MMAGNVIVQSFDDDAKEEAQEVCEGNDDIPMW